MHGDPLMEVSCAMPEDVVCLHDALLSKDKVLHLGNDGTALRFLTAYFAQKEGSRVVLDGSERLRERPIGPLVDVLRRIGVAIAYMGREGYVPIRIEGRKLRPLEAVTVDTALSTQFASALLLIGWEVQESVSSPYIALTRAMVSAYAAEEPLLMETDWGAAAFWYEYVALHGGSLLLPGLRADSMQADRAVVDIFARLGVESHFTANGCEISRNSRPLPCTLTLDFSSCPDAYPAVAVACHALGVDLQAIGVNRLPYKESDRLEAVRMLLDTPKNEVARTHHDHRIAMAAMVAGWQVDDVACVRKSYPQFYNELCRLRP